MFAVFLVSSCYLEVTLLTFYLYRGVPYARYVVICALFNYFTRLYRDIYVVLHCCCNLDVVIEIDYFVDWSGSVLAIALWYFGALAGKWHVIELCWLLYLFQWHRIMFLLLPKCCFFLHLHLEHFRFITGFFYWKPNNQVCFFTYVATQHTYTCLPFS